LCEKGDDITPFDGLSLLFSIPPASEAIHPCISDPCPSILTIFTSTLPPGVRTMMVRHFKNIFLPIAAEPHHFCAAPAPGKNYDPAPRPWLNPTLKSKF
jgi:hypothetical protein